MQVNNLRRLYWFVRGLLLLMLGIFIKRRPKPDFKQIKGVLIIALFRIGDAVYATPVLREIIRHFPDVKIDLVCRNYTADVFKNNPYLRNNYMVKNGIFEFWRIRNILRKKRYDLVIDLTADDKLIGAFFARSSNTSYCLGYNIQKRGFCLDQPVSYPNGKLHATQIFLNLLEGLEIPIHSNHQEIFITDNEKVEIKDLLSKYYINGQDFIVGLHPGANFPSQRLSGKKWAVFCDIVQEKFHKKVALFGGPKDRSLIEAIRQQATIPLIVIDKLPDLLTAIALIDRCNILLCNNSGPLHIAEALGTPTLSWMGPTIPHRWYPIGTHHLVIRKELDCAPCNRGTCKHHTCEVLITVNDFEESFKKLMGKISESEGT